MRKTNKAFITVAKFNTEKKKTQTLFINKYIHD